MNEPKTLWQSPETTPDGQPFLTIKQSRDYYYYAQRAGINSVFFILYDANISKFALISESKPPLDESLNTLAMLTTAFGGSIDLNKTYLEIVQQEVLEEAGYKVTPDDIYSMGSTLVSSQMDQIAFGYVVDVTNIEKTEETESEHPNASEEFANNSIKWLSYDEVIENSDWKSIFLVTKLIHAQPSKD